MVYAVRRTFAGFLAAAAVLAFPSPAGTAESPRGIPHSHFQAPDSCPRCHLAGSEGRPDPARFSPEADALCLECHRRESLGRTHPMNVRPADRYGKANVPADLRLADDGRMMCLTCHVAHGGYLSAVRAFPGQAPEEPGPVDEGRFRTFFLRRSDAERGAAPLCAACHRMPR
jgi:rRNA maturation protein Nop10